MNLYKLGAGCMLDVTWVAHTLHKSTTRTLASTLKSQVKGTDNGGPSFCSVRLNAPSPCSQQIEGSQTVALVGISPFKASTFFGIQKSINLHHQARLFCHCTILHRPSGPCVSRGCPVKMHQSGSCKTGGSAKSRVGKID